jgi:hypothetical protein
MFSKSFVCYSANVPEEMDTLPPCRGSGGQEAAKRILFRPRVVWNFALLIHKPLLRNFNCNLGSEVGQNQPGAKLARQELCHGPIAPRLLKPGGGLGEEDQGHLSLSS